MPLKVHHCSVCGLHASYSCIIKGHLALCSEPNCADGGERRRYFQTFYGCSFHPYNEGYNLEHKPHGHYVQPIGYTHVEIAAQPDGKQDPDKAFVEAFDLQPGHLSGWQAMFELRQVNTICSPKTKDAKTFAWQLKFPNHGHLLDHKDVKSFVQQLAAPKGSAQAAPEGEKKGLVDKLNRLRGKVSGKKQETAN